MILSCAVYLLFRKVHSVIFSRDWVRKKKKRKTCSNTGFEVLRAHRVRLFSVFRCSTQARGLLLRLSGGRREDEPHRAEGAWRRVPGPGLVAWRESHTGTFWMTGRSSCPQKRRFFLKAILWHAFFWKSAQLS